MRATAGRQAAAWPGRGLAWPFGVSSLRAGFLKVTGLGWADLLSSAEKKKKGSRGPLRPETAHNSGASEKTENPKFQIELPTTPP